jgi:hypothetical protein
MSQSICKILFLKVPGADEGFASAVAQNIPADTVQHEFLEVAPEQYDAILDRLGAGVLPIVLKAPR